MMDAVARELSFGEMFALGVVFLSLFWISGAVVHALLQDRGLGVIGNALVMMVGGGLGFYLKLLMSGPIPGA